MITIRKLGQHLNLILAVILLLVGSAFGQTRQEYTVSDFRGGLNLATDSIDQSPNEAIQADNTTLGKFGALHKRYGIINWNSSLISGGKLWNIHYVEDKNADKMLFFASNLHIYERKGWEDTVDVVGTQWNGMQVSYSRGIIDTAESGQRYIYGDTTSWLLAVDVDDNIEFEGDDAQTYQIDSVLADTILHLYSNLTDAYGDTTTYRIIKHVANPTLAKPGYADLSSWGGKLYVADGSHEPWYYDGEQPQLLGIVDSGTVTNVIAVDTTAKPYSTGKAELIRRSNIVRLYGADISDTAFTIGNIFHAIHLTGLEPFVEFSSRITGINTADSSIYLASAVNWLTLPGGSGVTPPSILLGDTSSSENSRWWINLKYGRKTSEQGQHIEDTTKAFPSGGDLVGFWLINGRDAKERGYISGNTDRTIRYDYARDDPQVIKITPSSANDSYTYIDTVAISGVDDASPTSWTSGAGTTIADVCDSMVEYINADTDISPYVTAVDSTTFYILQSDILGGFFSAVTDTAQDTTTTSSLDGVYFLVGDRYYVVRQHPEMRHPVIDWGYDPYPNPFGDDPYPLVPQGSTYTELNYFKQIIFHRNRLYAIGYSIVPKAAGGFSVGDTINTGRVWFSDIALPRYIFSDWNFDVTGANTGNQNLSLYSADACQRMFVLRDDLYIITNSNIYRLSGEPDVNKDGYGLYLSQVVRGIGTNQPYGIVVTKDNVAYIMNQQGIWHFDGNVINKISYNVDPLVERYRGSRMVAGKFKDNLFFSYPDSNKTLLFFDPLKKFVGPWDIGMLTINDQSVAIDSNYFLFSQSVNSSYVLKYPRDFVNFSDIVAPNDTAVVVFRYRPGWLTFGTLRDKVLEDIEITAFTINPVSGYDFLNYLALYRDFTDTVRWSATSFSEGTPINAFESIGDDGAIHGRAYQILVKDSTDNDFWLSNYLLRWYDPTR